MVLFLLGWSRSFPTAPSLIASHPSTLSMVQKKNKAWVYLLPCACGRFIHFISISFRRFVHSASLHSLHYPSLHFASVHFTNLSTAQQKQFLLFFPQSIHTGFPCHGVPIAYPHSLLTIGSAHATPSHQPGLLHSVQSLHLLFTHRTIESGMLYFFLRSVYHSQPTKDSTVSLENLA